MSKPRVIPDKSAIDNVVDIISMLLIPFSAAILGANYAGLPEEVYVNFNWPSKNPDGYGHKSLLWITPTICGIVVLALHWLNKYPWLFNYPTSINKDNAIYHYTWATRLTRYLALCIGSIGMYMTITALS